MAFKHKPAFAEHTNPNARIFIRRLGRSLPLCVTPTGAVQAPYFRLDGEGQLVSITNVSAPALITQPTTLCLVGRDQKLWRRLLS